MKMASARPYKCFCMADPNCYRKSCFSVSGCFYSAEIDPKTKKVHFEFERYGCLGNDSESLMHYHCNNDVLHPQSKAVVRCCNELHEDDCNLRIADHFKSSHIDKTIDIHYATFIPLMIFFLLLIAIVIFWLIKFKFQYDSEGKYKLKLFIKSDNTINEDIYELTEDKRYNSNNSRSLAFIKNTANMLPVNDDVISRCGSFTTGSGSGSGMPFLVQRTVARQTELLSCIGKGRYGEVWEGVCQSELVAVKIFSSRDEASWARETEIYNSGLLRHANVLAYYASDMLSRGGCTQLWLITAYHKQGSLYDHLLDHKLTLTACLRILRSCVSGLSFLHMEISGIHAKPAIAHRDIKTKNILLKNDGEVCIGDFGLALPKTFIDLPTCNSFINMPSDIGGGNQLKSSVAPPVVGPRVGTKRYMAPELLLCQKMVKFDNGNSGENLFINETMSSVSEESSSDDPKLDSDDPCVNEIKEFIEGKIPFDLYLKSDIYSFALVMWETLRRTQTNDKEVDPCSLPYANFVSADPSVRQMRRVVVYGLSDSDQEGQNQDVPKQPLRPPLSQRWLNDPQFREIIGILEKCWLPNWQTRMSSFNCKKELFSIEKSVLKKRQVDATDSSFKSPTEDSSWPVGLQDLIGLTSSDANSPPMAT